MVKMKPINNKTWEGIESFFYKHSWHLRKEIYRIKIFLKFRTHLLANWEYVDAMFHIPMLMFVNFYENCVVDRLNNYVDWSYHKKEKVVMDKIYKYYKLERPNLETRMEEALKEWSSVHIMDWIPCEDDKSCMRLETSYLRGEDDRGEALFQLHTDLEKEMQDKDDKYIVMLMKIRYILWE